MLTASVIILTKDRSTTIVELHTCIGFLYLVRLLSNYLYMRVYVYSVSTCRLLLKYRILLILRVVSGIAGVDLVLSSFGVMLLLLPQAFRFRA